MSLFRGAAHDAGVGGDYQRRGQQRAVHERLQSVGRRSLVRIILEMKPGRKMRRIALPELSGPKEKKILALSPFS